MNELTQNHEHMFRHVNPAHFMNIKVETGCSFCDLSMKFCNRSKISIWDNMKEDGFSLVCHHTECMHFPDEMPGVTESVGITCKRCRLKCTEDCHELTNAVTIERDASSILTHPGFTDEAA